MTDIDGTLAARGEKNGRFGESARVTQAIKRAMRDSPNWAALPDDMREALEMDANKTARILCGDASRQDHWHDKAGYATLVAKRLSRNANRQEA